MYDSWQPSLFGSVAVDVPSVDPSFHGLERIQLDADSWIDLVPGWLRGADDVCASAIERLPWIEREVVMWDRQVPEPRLTWWWNTDQPDPEPLPVFTEIRRALTAHYGIDFDSTGCNWYRNGRDSVAWHGDRVRHLVQPIVAIVSVGSPRPFLVRPRGGGSSIRFVPAHGDLLVMGGRCQHDWEHCVPKVASSGPRVSIMARHRCEFTAAGVRPPSG
ncbi:MAG: alpha-ketoglutarate-dependent dioxygenase AlkB [Ilumatobacteraceae bacterium]